MAFTREEILAHLAEETSNSLDDAEIELVLQRAHRLKKDERQHRDPSSKPCGWQGCQRPRLRHQGRGGHLELYCETHEAARQARLVREHERRARRKAKRAHTGRSSPKDDKHG